MLEETAMRILVVEDDQRVLSFLERGLQEEGFTVSHCSDGEQAADVLSTQPFDLVLLDWLLPKKSGIDLLTAMRAQGNITPVVMVTAKDDLSDRVAALNAGADDYITKPFSFAELLARVRAVLRRTQARASNILTIKDLTMNPQTRRISRAGTDIRLTAREFALLQFFMEHPGEVVSKTRIAENVWEHDFDTFSNVVEVYIRYLRRKIDEPFEVKLIHTVRGVGYRFGDEA